MKTNGIDIGFMRGNPQAIYDALGADYPARSASSTAVEPSW
ncbi:hypothetical protein P9209_26010 [Prescottella defluvii]|nr:hypothetical protein P9209_26010 [Prescottella defluvii]